MRISDWSSDVCSSDLSRAGAPRGRTRAGAWGADGGAELRTAAARILRQGRAAAAAAAAADEVRGAVRAGREPGRLAALRRPHGGDERGGVHSHRAGRPTGGARSKIGKAAWRERVCQYV